MKKYLLILAALIAVATGFWLGRTLQPATPMAGSEQSHAERDVLYWVAPMDPDYRRDQPGKSPMGMDLIPVYAGARENQPGVVSIDPRIVNNLAVRTVVAEYGALSRRIKTVGYVAYDEDTVQHVHTRVEGWIEHLATRASGDPVTRGQLLFELYSPTLVNAQEEYLTALRSNNAVLSKASRGRLAALGVTPSEIDALAKERTVLRQVRVTASTDGVVAKLGVREGMYVTPATEIMSVASLDKVWVIAEVFARQAGWVHEGQRAIVTLESAPSTRLEARVDYVYPELDPTTRTLKVRMRFDNKSETLRPNMFTRVEIEAEGVGDVVHVPRNALIRGGAADRVVVALGDGKFRSQPVTAGIESGERIEIREGLARGDRVVTSAQFLIDSESNIATALQRMDGGSEAPSADGARKPEALP
ncbi:MAG TPA: efflux RND transporter periplasmic adaptor subunit [Woeseiaceae bacterium]|nr:efflux RND transporter periplasmic adaptor subunit [Woeseiaceae bacterium]